jgi:hypothetical protein
MRNVALLSNYMMNLSLILTANPKSSGIMEKESFVLGEKGAKGVLIALQQTPLIV